MRNGDALKSSGAFLPRPWRHSHRTNARFRDDMSRFTSNGSLNRNNCRDCGWPVSSARTYQTRGLSRQRVWSCTSPS